MQKWLAVKSSRDYSDNQTCIQWGQAQGFGIQTLVYGLLTSFIDMDDSSLLTEPLSLFVLKCSQSVRL